MKWVSLEYCVSTKCKNLCVYANMYTTTKTTSLTNKVLGLGLTVVSYSGKKN